MSLPINYKQIAAGLHSPTSAPVRSRFSVSGSGPDRQKDNTALFTNSNYGNSAFTPQRAGKSSSRHQGNDLRNSKLPKPPDKPLLPYMRYSKRVWESFKAQHPDLKLWEMGKKLGAAWKQLSDGEKQQYIDEYEADKVEYEKALKAYYNSPAYVAARNKQKTDAEVQELPRLLAKNLQERRIDIQPAEDEDGNEDDFSYKNVAYLRYLRNHRLINEIFSDSVLPDPRTVVTPQRLLLLKRQVSSLTMHQKKLETELELLETKFAAKKQRLTESSEAFEKELELHCLPVVSRGRRLKNGAKNL